MKIGIDISQIVYEGTGVSRFTTGLTNAILEFDKKNEWTFFFSSFRRNLDRELENRIKSKGHKLIKWNIPPTLLSFFWNDLHAFSKSFKFQVSSFKNLDWFITSDWTEPPLAIKKVTIVHDLVYLRYPETVDSKILNVQKKRLNWVKKESQVIFADSESTKSDLVNILTISKNRIVVNYPGVEVKIPPNDQIKKTLEKYKLKKPFILSVGKQEPRKNMQSLILAMKQLNSKPIDLVVVGAKGWDNTSKNSINQLNEFIAKDIKFLDYIIDSEMFSLYKSCLFFIYPSIWEGFGYPVVEAMKLGVPVATSNTSSLKEIAKDAALLFNPNDVDDIRHSINTMIQDQKLRTELKSKSLERSKIFSWKNYYEKFIHSLTTNPQTL